MNKRNVNVDLFRIIATILVIVLHVLGQGEILQNASPSELNYWGGVVFRNLRLLRC